MLEKKKELRRKCFAAVKSLNETEKASSSREICEKLVALPTFRDAETVFSYLPLPSEPDLTPLFGDSKVWGFARVLSDNSMEFRAMENLSDSVVGEFSIREPNPENTRLLSLSEADMILVPGVGFDSATGDRLGRGKGHYDRYLAPLLVEKSRPLIIGVCFAAQICSLETEEHDIAMDRVISA